MWGRLYMLVQVYIVSSIVASSVVYVECNYYIVKLQLTYVFPEVKRSGYSVVLVPDAPPSKEIGTAVALQPAGELLCVCSHKVFRGSSILTISRR